MIPRSERSHLVPIARILEEEMFHLLRNLQSASVQEGKGVEGNQETYLERGQKRAPLVYEFCEHTIRPRLVHFA